MKLRMWLVPMIVCMVPMQCEIVAREPNGPESRSDARAKINDSIVLPGAQRSFDSSGVTKAISVWKPGSVIHVYFKNGNAEQRSFVANTANEWAKYGNFTFKFHPEAMPARGAYGILIEFGIAGRSVIGAGTSSPDYPSMTLSHDVNRLEILHEFGHALGLLHEFENPASLPYLQPVDDSTYNLLEEYLGWSRTEADRRLLKKVVPPALRKPFDPHSVMGYDQWIIGDIYRGKITMSPSSDLTEMDKQYIARLYPGRRTPASFEPVVFPEDPDMKIEATRTYVWQERGLLLRLPESVEIKYSSHDGLKFSNEAQTLQAHFRPGKLDWEEMDKIALATRTSLFGNIKFKNISWSGNHGESRTVGKITTHWGYSHYRAEATINGSKRIYTIYVADLRMADQSDYNAVIISLEHDRFRNQINSLLSTAELTTNE